MSEFTVRTRTDGAATIVSLNGAADLNGAETLERALTPIAARHPRQVMFDLSGLTVIASLAIGHLIAFHRAVAAWNGTVAIAGASGVVADALRRCRLDQVFTFAPTVEAAIAEPT